MAIPQDAVSELVNRFNTAVDGLYYSSESDYPFEVFVVQGEFATSLSADTLLQQLKKPQNQSVDTLTLDQFFTPLTSIDHQQGESAKAIAQRFQTLATLICDTLTHITVYRIGTIEIDIYIVGQVCVEPAIAPSAPPIWIVIATKAVET
jgi:Nuclease A inhibitor-like protein